MNRACVRLGSQISPGGRGYRRGGGSGDARAGFGARGPGAMEGGVGWEFWWDRKSESG